jgi:hypothetical protein
LLSEEYSLGGYQTIDALSYAIIAKNGDVVFESSQPNAAIGHFLDLVGKDIFASSIDRYTEKN